MNESAPPINRKTIWPIVIGAALVLHVFGVMVMVYVATRDHTFVEADYYQKSLDWDKTRADNVRLAWKIKFELGPPEGVLAERKVQCELRDREGQPIADAMVDLMGFPHAKADDPAGAALLHRMDATYDSKIRCLRRGLWEFRIVVRRGGDTMTFTEQRVL